MWTSRACRGRVIKRRLVHYCASCTRVVSHSTASSLQMSSIMVDSKTEPWFVCCFLLQPIPYFKDQSRRLVSTAHSRERKEDEVVVMAALFL